LVQPLFEAVSSNVLLDYLVVDVDVALSVARQVVQALKSSEEGSHENKHEICHQCWSALLVNEMTNELGQPSKNMDSYHGSSKVATESLLLNVTIQAVLTRHLEHDTWRKAYQRDNGIAQ
tara:strand:+ start:171 stop:530 length:360 start_codon:yes stop_codon:yes gene_type:complete